MSIKKIKIIVLVEVIFIVLGLVGFICYINRPREDCSANSLNQQEVAMFNGKFEKYFGKQSGVIVLSLISQAITSNQAAINSNSNRIVSISLNGQGYVNDVTDLSKLREQINRSHIYDVNCIYGDTDGYITKIIIQA